MYIYIHTAWSCCKARSHFPSANAITRQVPLSGLSFSSISVSLPPLCSNSVSS